MNPDDEDINFNLNLAYRETIDKIEPVPQVFYEEWWDNFVTSYPVNRRAVILLALIWVFCIAAISYVLAGRPFLKKISFIVAAVFFFVSSMTGIVLWKQLSSIEQNRAAIILNPSVYVKSSPDDEGSNVFMLHEGTKVDVLDSLQNWSKIKIANGNVGWLRTGDFEQI